MSTTHHRLALASLAAWLALNAQAQVAPPVPGPAMPPADAKATASQTITVTGKTSQGDMRKGALRDDIVKTESISERAIERVSANNVNEALEWRRAHRRGARGRRLADCARGAGRHGEHRHQTAH